MGTNTPEVFYRNLIQIAANGITDKYGNHVIGLDTLGWSDDQFQSITASSKRFNWTATDYQYNQNFQAEADAEGAQLKINDSKHVYQITNVDRTNDYIQTSTTPNTSDTKSDFTIEAGANFYNADDVWTKTSAYPLHNVYDNYIYTQCQTDDQSSAMVIKCGLPNLIRDGCFGYQVTAGAGGQAPDGTYWNRVNNDWLIADPNTAQGGVLLYGQNAYINTGGGDDYLYQYIPFECVKGETYVLTFAVVASDTTESGCLTVALKCWDDPEYEAITSSTTAYVDDTYAPYDVGVITSSGKFVRVEYTADRDSPGMYISFFYDDTYKGAASQVTINCVSLTKKMVATSLIIANHELSQATINVYGFGYLSGSTEGDDPSEINYGYETLVGNGTIETDPYIATWTNTYYWPYYYIEITPSDTMPLRIGNVYLGEKWDWSEGLQPPIDPDRSTVKSNRIQSISGAIDVFYDNEVKVVSGSLYPLQPSEVTKWQTFWDEWAKYGKPFWFRKDSSGELRYMVADMDEISIEYNPKLRQLSFSFREQK